MSEWVVEPGESTLKDRQDPAESFAKMEEEALAEDPQATVSAITPCNDPWLELTLTLGEEPAANAPYRLIIPGGETRTGTLDGKGYVKIENVDVGSDEVELRVEVTEAEKEGDPPTFEIQLVPPSTEGEEEPEDDEETAIADPEFFRPTFDGRIVKRPYDDEDAEDEIS